MNISSSLEDYIEAISEIIEKNEHAHTKEIADRLHVKMPSATNALQTLHEKGLIKYQSHTPVTLTEAGAKMGEIIRRRHNNLKMFFSNILQLDEKTADLAACKVEHVIGDNISARIAFLSETINHNEDCAALRDLLKCKLSAITEDCKCCIPVSLSELNAGESAIIVSVDENLKGIKKFSDLGLIKGTYLKMEGKAPFGQLIRIKVMESSLSINSEDAKQITVKKIISLD